MASILMGLLGSITGSGIFPPAVVTMESGGLDPSGPANVVAPFVICLTSVPGPREPGCFRTW